MRMIITSIMLFSSGGPAWGALPESARKADQSGCENHKPGYVRQSEQLEAKPLNQMPSADRILTVRHSVNGCVKPLVVEKNVGARQR